MSIQEVIDLLIDMFMQADFSDPWGDVHVDEEAYNQAVSEAGKMLLELKEYRDMGLTPQMVKDLIKSEKAAHKAALENAHIVDECREAEKRSKERF